MTINSSQTEITGKGGFTNAVFVEYAGESRCSKCVFQSNDKKCKFAPCSPDERKDGRRGFFRAFNANTSPYRLADGCRL